MDNDVEVSVTDADTERLVHVRLTDAYGNGRELTIDCDQADELAELLSLAVA